MVTTHVNWDTKSWLLKPINNLLARGELTAIALGGSEKLGVLGNENFVKSMQYLLNAEQD